MASTDASSDAGTAAQRPMKILVYTDDNNTRQQVAFALGRRPDPDLPEVEITDVATAPHVWRALDTGEFDVAILDGEAAPAGGMGVARQVKDEVFHSPPVLVIVGRPQDGWLATWSRADAVVSHPIDAIALARATAGLMRQRLGIEPASA